MTARGRKEPGPPRFGRIVLALALIGTATITTALWTLTDRWWVAVPLGYGPRWPWLALAPLPLAALGLRWRIRLAAALVIAATITVYVTGFRWSWTSDPGSGTGLKVVTFNAANRNAAITEMLEFAARSDADVFAVIECPRIRRYPSRDGYSFSVAGEICLWTRGPIAGRIEIMPRDAARIGWSGTVARIHYPFRNDTVTIGIVHLRSVRNELKEFLDISEIPAQADSMTLRHTKRLLGSAEASDWLRNDPRPAGIVVGDFNLVVEGTAWRRDWSYWTDSWESRGRGFGYTWSSTWSRLRIDHVIHDDRWLTRRVAIGPMTASDHRAVAVELERR